MKRSFLEALGLEKDAIDQIMTEYGKDVEKLKADISVLENEKTTLSESLKERDTQLEDLKGKAGDNAALQDQIAELQKSNAAEVERLTSENNQIRINAAVEQALLIAKAKNVKAAKALLNLEGAELTDDGTVKGLAEQIKGLQEAETSGFLFDSTGAEFKGVTPRDGKDGVPPMADYQSRYSEAKKSGNQLEAIRLKMEAFENGQEVI